MRTGDTDIFDVAFGHEPPDLTNTVFLILHMLVCIWFTCFSVYALRHPDKVTASFHQRGTELFGEKVAGVIYRQENLKWAAVPIVIMGPVLVVVGAIGAVRGIIG